jgi:vacuolar-type H+-ATPase subunit H
MSDKQEQYINSLKKIKEVEENTQKEIENHRKEISEKISQLEPDLKNAIASANTEGEKLVESSIEQSRKTATAKTAKIIEETKTKAENISSQIMPQNTEEIIDILLKGVE